MSVFDGRPLQYPVAQSSISKCKKRICVFPPNLSHVPAHRNVDTTFEAQLWTSVIVIDLHNSILPPPSHQSKTHHSPQPQPAPSCSTTGKMGCNDKTGHGRGRPWGRSATHAQTCRTSACVASLSNIKNSNRRSQCEGGGLILKQYFCGRHQAGQV